jgi:hypothetical protein
MAGGRRRRRADKHLQFRTVAEKLPNDQHGMVDCELSELMLSIGAKQYGVVAGCVVARGESNTVIRLGVNKENTPHWHVLKPDEVDLLSSAGDDFVKVLLDYNLRWDLKRDDMNNSFDDGLILVGCLLEPERCKEVWHESEFVPSVAGGKRVSEGETLKTAQTWVLGTWRGFKSAMPTFDGGIQIDTAIPGTETKLSGKLVKRAKVVSEYEWSADYVLAKQIRTFRKAMSTMVFVYENVDGQVSEQNLYCIVDATVKNLRRTEYEARVTHSEVSPQERTDATSPSPESPLQRWYQELDQAEQRFAQTKSSEAFVWAQKTVQAIRLCDCVLQSGSRIVKKGTIGGVDLVELARTGRKERVSEKCSKLPAWAQVKELGDQIGVAVHQLGKDATVRVQNDLREIRCRLIVSGPGLERPTVLGPMRKVGKNVTTGSIHFVSDRNKTTITLTDVNDSKWPTFQDKAMTAAAFVWDTVYVPSAMQIGQYRPAKINSIVVESTEKLTLTEWLHGGPGSKTHVGLLLEIEGLEVILYILRKYLTA